MTFWPHLWYRIGIKQVVGVVAFGSVIGIGATLFTLCPIGPHFEERTGLVWLFAMRGPIKPPPYMVIVAIDQRSAEHLRLPESPREWPRSLHARLIENLERHGASIIVFDLKFERPQSPNEDHELAKAIGSFGRVLLVQGRDRADQGEIVDLPLQPEMVEAALGTAPFPLPRLPSRRISQVWAFHEDRPTLPALAMIVGERDAYKAWIRLSQQQGLITDDLALAEHGSNKAFFLPEVTSALRRASKNDPEVVRTARAALANKMSQRSDGATARAFTRRDALLRLYEGQDSFYLNFYGPPGTIPTVSYHEAVSSVPMAAQKQALDIKGKTVFVGVSELAKPVKEDGFPTVFSRSDGVDLSGVEIAATAFANLVTDGALKPAKPEVSGPMLLAVGIIVTTCAFLLPATWAIIVALAVGIGYAVAAQLLFEREAVWLPLATPLVLQIPLAVMLGFVVQNVWARRQRQHMERAISYYLPSELVDGLADHPINPISVHETKFAICLATDAENFTALSESMSPDQAASFLMTYFEMLAEPMQRHGAEFKEFHADSALFAWISNPSDAVRTAACRAALEAVAALESLDVENTLRVRVGLNAGNVFIGNIGAGGRFAFRMVGDIVNTASRVEALNKQLGTRILATDTVFAGADGLLIRPLGAFRLRGRRNATSVAEILCAKEQACNLKIDLCRRFAKALHAYRAGRREAADLFQEILERYPEDGPSRFYRNRCSRLR